MTMIMTRISTESVRVVLLFNVTAVERSNVMMENGTAADIIVECDGMRSSMRNRVVAWIGRAKHRCGASRNGVLAKEFGRLDAFNVSDGLPVQGKPRPYRD
jgi:hypothetical protein